MREDYSLYRKAIKEKVCTHCIDFGEDGRCKLSDDHVCGVEAHLDKMIQIVRTVKSDKIEDYVQAMRKQICNHCENKGENSECLFRQEIDCALDRYLPLVIDAIEEVEKSD